MREFSIGFKLRTEGKEKRIELTFESNTQQHLTIKNFKPTVDPCLENSIFPVFLDNDYKVISISIPKECKIVSFSVKPDEHDIDCLGWNVTIDFEKDSGEQMVIQEAKYKIL